MSPRSRTDSYRDLVLVADADEQAACRAAAHLARLGLLTFQTTEGGEAIRLARVYPPTLAVVDATLLDMPGRDLVGALRALGAGLPIVMTAAQHGAQTEIEARVAGIVYYAPKPVDLDHLVQVVRRAVSLARARRRAAAPTSWPGEAS